MSAVVSVILVDFQLKWEVEVSVLGVCLKRAQLPVHVKHYATLERNSQCAADTSIGRPYPHARLHCAIVVNSKYPERVLLLPTLAT